MHVLQALVTYLLRTHDLLCYVVAVARCTVTGAADCVGDERDVGTGGDNGVVVAHGAWHDKTPAVDGLRDCTEGFGTVEIRVDLKMVARRGGKMCAIMLL